MLKASPSATTAGDLTFESGSLTGLTGGTAPALETAAPLQGTYSAKATVGTSYIQRTLASAADELYATVLLKVNSLPSASARVIQVLGSGSTTQLEVQLLTNGKLRLRNNGTTIGSDSITLSTGTTYTIGIHQKKGTGSNAVMEAWVAAGDSLPVTVFASSSALALTAQATTLRVGATTSTVTAVTIDNVQTDTAAWPVRLSGAKTRTYMYDGVQRVTGGPDGTFAYDDAGNVTDNGGLFSGVTYGTDSQGSNWDYDDRSNITGDTGGSFAFTWDGLDRLRTRTAGGRSTDATYVDRTLINEVINSTTTITYSQDVVGGLSHALQRNEAGAKTSYIYGLGGRVIAFGIYPRECSLYIIKRQRKWVYSFRPQCAYPCGS